MFSSLLVFVSVAPLPTKPSLVLHVHVGHCDGVLPGSSYTVSPVLIGLQAQGETWFFEEQIALRCCRSTKRERWSKMEKEDLGNPRKQQLPGK